jgi:hypothetical protein
VAEAEQDRLVKRIAAIQVELVDLYRKTHPPVTPGSIATWVASGVLTICGVVFARSTDGSSLTLSLVGVAVFLVDTARQVKDRAGTIEEYRRADELQQELLDHVSRLRQLASRPKGPGQR